MKTKYLLVILTFLIWGFLEAQEQISVEYELIEPEENFRDSSLPKGLELKIPKRYFELIIYKDESIWKNFDKVDNDQNAGGGLIGKVSFYSPYGDIYKNINQKVKMFEATINSKKYIVEDSLREIDWRLTRETKQILNIQVQKAIYINKEEGVELIAWYAPKLYMKHGPDQYWNLPGLILQIETISYLDDNSKMSETYTATKIKTIQQNKKIEKPKKGTIITQKEFDKILKESLDKVKEMRDEGVDKD